MFLVAGAIQYGLYHYLLRQPLRARDLEKAKPAYLRWIAVDVVWQGLVIAGSGAYVLAVGAHHPAGFAWVTPAVGATFGTALPLQIVVIATMRWGRGG